MAFTTQVDSILLGGQNDRLPENTSVNLDSSMSAADIQALINAQPRNLNGYTLTFQFADGTYTLSAKLSFMNFCSGYLYIQGNTTEANANDKHTTQQVILDCSDNGIYISSILNGFLVPIIFIFSYFFIIFSLYFLINLFWFI